VSHALQAALLVSVVLVYTASRAHASPFSMLMGYPQMGYGHGGGMGRGSSQSYRCQSSYNQCSMSKDEYSTKSIRDPKCLVGMSSRRRMRGGEVELPEPESFPMGFENGHDDTGGGRESRGLKVVVKDNNDPQDYMDDYQDRPHGYGYHGYGAGMGGMGYGMGGMGYGMGGMGYGMGYGKGYGMGNGMGYGMGYGYSDYADQPELQLDLELNIRRFPKRYQNDATLDVLVVFNRCANPQMCDLDSLGKVVTGPEEDGQGQSHGYGYGQDMLSAYGGSHYGGPYDESRDINQQYGVLAVLEIKRGMNFFTIKGLGAFTKLSQLAGLTVSLCEDVTMSYSGHPMCTGSDDGFGVLFCAPLSYQMCDMTTDLMEEQMDG